MTLEQAETCRQVAKIIEDRPESFDMREWRSECGTTMCIAGHVGALHGDRRDESEESSTFFSCHSPYPWEERQAERIGLTSEAGEDLFMGPEYQGMSNSDLTKILRAIADRIERSDEMIAPASLRGIVAKALK